MSVFALVSEVCDYKDLFSQNKKKIQFIFVQACKVMLGITVKLQISTEQSDIFVFIVVKIVFCHSSM